MENKTIPEIARARNVQVRTIEDHIVELYRRGSIQNLTQFGFDNWIKCDILGVYQKMKGSNSEKPLSYIHGKTRASYFHIKLALAKI